ncbi:tetratricopeptide repeat protein [Streptomyces globosus]|uniref:Tetratricopeptide repeat protein n=1 Tax=Streptomyces globosus TaxID=68209 RepID=A0A344U897_9ACTN|nr:tetratricopeptide repeat protein [Streptomyces globosus]AXE27118.1 tetratricopeptide repeat protein [Streptomyces globosus]
MTTMTPDEVRQALQENRSAPNGSARNAHAEALAGAAEATGDKALFREALDNLITSYLHSAESSKMLVPFARLLQEYDQDPGSFGRWDVHTLFWQFKWIGTAIGDSPEIPLDSARGWLEEMERRYRLAGYSERPVREAEMWLADATGDDERADRAMRAWLAAERDAMSDCHACELNSQGQYAALRGDDARALELWQPVLTGGLTCAEEPHRVLAASLLPLLRLGRLDEARRNHIRGYRLARGNESLLPSVGRHIEFCALSGNESRGLEILAEHAGHLGALANADDQLDFHGGVLVLLRRLEELGHGSSPAVPYADGPRTVSALYAHLHASALDIARRFDARNRSPRTSERFLARVGRQPLVGVLPLGVRSAPLPQTEVEPPSAVPSRRAAEAADAAAPAEGFAELVERARTARDQGHPAADALWAEAAARAAALPESAVDPLTAADLADSRALAAARAGAPEAADLLAAARDGYRTLGQAQRAALAELRLASAAAQDGAAPERIRALLAAGAEAAEALEAGEPLRGRRIALAELAALRLEPYLRSLESHGGDGPPEDHGHGAEVAAEQAARLTAFAAAHRGSLPDLAAEAEEMLGRIALSQGDPEGAAPLLDAAAARAAAAGRPWLAVDPLTLLAGVLMALGRPEEAEQAARTGLEHAAEVTDAEAQGAVRLTLADILLRRGDAASEAAEHALAAAHWFDQAGLVSGGGAQARFTLARAHAVQGHHVDAAEVLRSALPDLLEHGEGQAVGAREFLGDLLAELNEPQEAAEQYLLAAETAEHWEDQRPHAHLAHSAADQLARTGLPEEAAAAWERALELYRRAGGEPVSEARILRSLAWQALREEVTAPAAAHARSRMDQAADVLHAALAGAPEDPHLLAELAQTWYQLAQLADRQVVRSEELTEEYGADGEEDGSGGPRPAGLLDAQETEALRREEVDLCRRAAAVYRQLGPDHLADRLQCEQYAAWTEQELGREEAGAARIAALVEEFKALPEGLVGDLLERAEYTLAQLSQG